MNKIENNHESVSENLDKKNQDIDHEIETRTKPDKEVDLENYEREQKEMEKIKKEIYETDEQQIKNIDASIEVPKKKSVKREKLTPRVLLRKAVTFINMRILYYGDRAVARELMPRLKSNFDTMKQVKAEHKERRANLSTDLAKHKEGVLNRTFPKRHKDSEKLVTDIVNGKNLLSEAMNISKENLPIFIDVGPGLMEEDHSAVSTLEMARGVKNMQTIIIDLPDTVRKFHQNLPAVKNGKGDLKNETFHYTVNPKAKKDIESQVNITIVSGDGSKSLKNQIKNVTNNPYFKGSIDDYEIAKQIDKKPIIIRMANSIDDYLEWDTAYTTDDEGKYKVTKGTVMESFDHIVDDFYDQDVLILFHDKILIKKKGAEKLSAIGQLHFRGFEPNYRYTGKSMIPAYRLNKRKIKKLNKVN